MDGGAAAPRGDEGTGGPAAPRGGGGGGGGGRAIGHRSPVQASSSALAVRGPPRQRRRTEGVIGLEVYSLSLDAIDMRGAHKRENHEEILAREMHSVWGHWPSYIANCRLLRNPDSDTRHDGRNPAVQIELVDHEEFQPMIRKMVTAMRNFGRDMYGRQKPLCFDATGSPVPYGVFRVLCYCNSCRHRAVGVGQILALATGCSAQFCSPHMLRHDERPRRSERRRCSCPGCEDGASPDMDHILAARICWEMELIRNNIHS